MVTNVRALSATATQAPRRERTPSKFTLYGFTLTACVAYVGLVVGWQTLRFTPVGGWWAFELLDIFGLLLYAPLLPLLLLAMLVANRRAGLWLMVPLVVLAWEYGPLFLPRAVPRLNAPGAETQGQPLRVLTANLLLSNQSVTAVGGLLLMERPDLVAIQELSPAMADHLGRELRQELPYQLLEPSADHSGLGILSRYPFLTEVAGGDLPRPCFCQRVVVDLDGHKTTLVNVHPWPPEMTARRLARLPIPTAFDPGQTSRAIETALADVHQRPGALLVAGDFNTSDRQPFYRQLGRGLQDTHREVGWGLGFTFPSIALEGLPLLSIIRIDYIFHDRSVVARAARTGVTPGSDHLHVVADLVVR